MLFLFVQLLEKALRSYPSSVADRWEKIAEMVKSRTKDECIARFKVTIEDGTKSENGNIKFWCDVSSL